MMELQSTLINGLYVVNTNIVQDTRGYFYRSYSKSECIVSGKETNFVQTNVSHNFKKGSIRGLHLQRPPNAEIKLVRCIRGKILDVAVDLRKNSATFLNYFAIELSESNALALWIPEGMAHGFQVLEDQSTLLYQHSAYYNGSTEFFVSYLDPRINIQWPMIATEISEKDLSTCFLSESFEGIEI